ncbi:MAG: hypothetical protein CTY39_02640 [Hyphomicrobium sp.]|nr:MAG: hypothetical protein CTY39_02640 [Hyphomicrobium sp.]
MARRSDRPTWAPDDSVFLKALELDDPLSQPLPELRDGELAAALWLLAEVGEMSLPAEVRAAARLVKDALTQGRAHQLAAALDCETRGATLDLKLRTYERGVYLRHLHRTLHAGLPLAAAARLLSIGLRRYESTRWKRERNLITAPLDEPSTSYWRILKLDAGIPTPRTIRRALAT